MRFIHGIALIYGFVLHEGCTKIKRHKFEDFNSKSSLISS